jgi:lipoprotein-releasing system permease protein
LISLEEARELLSMEDGVVSSLEVKLAPGYDIRDTYDRIQEYMGEGFTVKDRYQQENSILKLMQVEKWVGFAIVCLMMILISFNLVGALWMIVLEKKRDISILKSLGMTRGDIRGIFLRVGLLLCGLGVGVGFLLAAGLYILQKNYGLISLPGMMTEAYPISFRWYDFPIVAATVLFIGFLASLLPAWRAQQIEASIHEE